MAFEISGIRRALASGSEAAERVADTAASLQASLLGMTASAPVPGMLARNFALQIPDDPEFSGMVDRLGDQVATCANEYRPALDRLAWQIHVTHGGDETSKQVYFPIIDDERQWDKRAKRYLPTAPDPVLAAIRQFQPFLHPQGALAVIRDLSNAPKHKAPHVVASAFQGIAPYWTGVDFGPDAKLSTFWEMAPFRLDPGPHWIARVGVYRGEDPKTSTELNNITYISGDGSSIPDLHYHSMLCAETFDGVLYKISDLGRIGQDIRSIINVILAALPHPFGSPMRV